MPQAPLDPQPDPMIESQVAVLMSALYAERALADDLADALDELVKATCLTAPPGIDVSALARYRQARGR